MGRIKCPHFPLGCPANIVPKTVSIAQLPRLLLVVIFRCKYTDTGSAVDGGGVLFFSFFIQPFQVHLVVEHCDVLDSHSELLRVQVG